MSRCTLAFDVYGTLIDTGGVYRMLVSLVQDRAPQFMETWRTKQLEYSWRLALMQQYVDFSVCTRHALDFTCLKLSLNLSDSERKSLLDVYQELPAFPEVQDCLLQLKRSGHSIYALSNGSKSAVTQLLKHNRILDYFTQIVSVEDVKIFKPSPIVYRHFNESTRTDKRNTWLISGNVFDVAGASAYGMQTVWIQRKPDAIFDPGMGTPTRTLEDLRDLPTALDSLT